MSLTGGKPGHPSVVISRWPPIAIWLSTVALLALVWTHVYFQVSDMQSRAFSTASQSLSDLTRVTQEHAIRTFRGADQALQFVIARYRAEGNKLSLTALIDQGVIDNTLFAQIGIVNPIGVNILGSIPFKKGLDLSDREHFKVHVQTDTHEMFVSKPVIGRASGKWSIQLSRRINQPDGSFGGVAVVSMDAQYFSKFYADLTPLPDDLSALIGLDGVMRVRQLGRQESFGENVEKSLALKLIAGGAMMGFYTVASPIDNVERLYNYRKIPGFALLSLNGVSTAAIRASYAPIRNALLMQAAVVSLLLIGMAVAILRYSSRLQRTLAEREQAAVALRHSEERLELALIGGEQSAWDWDLTADTIYVSALMLKMLGIEGHDCQLSKTQLLSVIHPDDHEKSRSQLITHLTGRVELLQIEFRLRCLDGSYRWMLIRGKVVERKDGRSTRLAGSSTDITEQRFAQEQVRDRTAQLDAIFTLSPDAFVTFDRAHRVKYVNPAFTKITGLSPSEVKQLGEEEFSTQLAKLCTGAQPFRGITALRLDTNDSSETRHDRLEFSPPNQRILKVGLKLSESDSVSQILYFRDVTHETIVEEMKSEFMSTAAHELRTPLTSVLGFAEVLLTQELDLESQQACLNIILAQAKHLASILDELLDLARIEARRGKDFVFLTVDLKSLVQEVVNDFKCPQDRTAPELSIPTTYCLVDVGKVKQVILNVISNAYKYSHPGTCITITCVQSEQGPNAGTTLVGLAIQDQGIGMSADHLERVFERFYRADTSGTVLGTGLGMSIVKEIMDLHSGTVTVQSTLGKGTSVKLMFPEVNPLTKKM